MNDRVHIEKLPSGVPGLDDVLGGGIPKFSFNLIAGAPGCGKTTLAHQIMFANATPDRPALYVTILGEPPLKMLRYQQQFGFFDVAKVPGSVRFLHLGVEALNGGLESVLNRIIAEVERTSPGMVIVDSFRSVAQKVVDPGQVDLQHFVQRLSLKLTSWEATTFLVGEYSEQEENNPIFTVADGIIWMYQSISRNSVVRRMQVLKMRGQEQSPGLHTLKISDAGVRIYPRMPNPDTVRQPIAAGVPRLSTGVRGLDAMMGGGIPPGYSILIVGPSGSGKTVLSTQFIEEGLRNDEPGVVAVFEKRPEEYLRGAPDKLKIDNNKSSLLKVLHLRPLDLSVDETMEEIRSAVLELGAKRVVIDSLSGFELALAPAFREDFRESLYRMVGAITGLGATVLLTAEQVESYTELRLSPHGIAFLADAVVLQRYVELNGRLERFMTVIKMRGQAHSKELRAYEIDANGLAIGEAMAHHVNLLRGLAVPKDSRTAGEVSET